MDMVKPFTLYKYDLLSWSFRFYGNHFLSLLGLSLMAALGRTIQMGAMGEISSGWYISLEVLVESSRILILILVIGNGQIKSGVWKCKYAFTMKKYDRKRWWQTVTQNFRNYWPALLWNIIIFSFIALLINYLINTIADYQPLLTKLKDWQVLTDSASSLPVIFFLKNLTVIPFAIIFECGIFLRLSGKI